MAPEDKPPRLRSRLAPIVATALAIASLAGTGATFWFEGLIREFLIGALCLLCAGLAFALARATAEQRDGVVAVYSQLLDPPWRRLFSEAAQVEIVARFCDAVLEYNGDALNAFFRRGGRMSLTLPDPDDAQVIAHIGRQRNALQRYKSDPRQMVTATLEIAGNAADRYTDPGSATLRVHLLDHAPNYAAYCFDQRWLILTLYEHSFREGCRAPRQLIDLHRSESYRLWWEHETDSHRKYGKERSVEALLARNGHPGTRAGGGATG